MQERIFKPLGMTSTMTTSMPSRDWTRDDVPHIMGSSPLFIWSSSWNEHIGRANRTQPSFSQIERINQKMTRKILSVSVFAALLCFASVSVQAAEGCGRGAHRAPDGRCYLNGRVVVEPVPVVVAPVVVAPPVGVVCGPGLRWHPGRRRCWAY